MKLMRLLAAFSILTASSAAFADAIDVNLNNNTAQFQYSTANGPSAQGRADLHGGVLYNNNKSLLFNAGIMVRNNLENAPGVSAGIGLEALAASIKDLPPTAYSASAIALDVLLRYSPPTASHFGIAGELHYAPRIMTFGDAVRYSQGIVRAEYELAPQTLVYIGYRRTSFGMKIGPSAVLDSGAIIGFKLGF